MFKKSLVAVAVLGAAAFSAQAADVTLYGVVDYGFNWTQKDVQGEKTDSFGLVSGQNAGSRFGLKGVEDLGNGYKVGFNLENGFNADDGTLGNGGRLFGREALAFVQSGWGELAFGRTGALDAGTGRYNLMGSGASAMGTGWQDVGNSTDIFLGTGDRMDNTVTYQSPNFAGLTVYAQASLKKDKDQTGVEGSSNTDRYYALGAKYAVGGFNAGLVVSQTDYARPTLNAASNKDGDDALVVSAFTNYDFGFVKPMVAVQYWDGGLEDKDSKVTFRDKLTKGYGVMVGATAPVFGGKLYTTVGYNDYADDAVDPKTYDGNNFVVGAGYEYSLSKRTMLYTAAGYKQAELDYVAAGTDTVKTKTTQVMAGMVHKF